MEKKSWKRWKKLAGTQTNLEECGADGRNSEEIQK
jgi:hypothetical protein